MCEAVKCLVAFFPALALLSGMAVAADLQLVEAAKNRDRETVRALLEQHVDVNRPQGDGATALHWAAYWDDAAMADVLIRSRANVNAANDLGVTPLALASSEAIADQLLKAGANPNIVTTTGESPLMAAARIGNLAIVTALLEHGADANARENIRGQTALMWAVAEEHPEVVRILLEHGADVRARTLPNPRFFYTGDSAGGGGRTDSTTRTIDTGGSTALMFAARQGDLACAKYLLAAGANPNDTSADGMSALVLAVYSGHGDVATLLLSKDANPNAADVGYTALHTAVLRGDLELLKTLLAHGANPNAKITLGTPVTRYGEDLILPSTLIGATPFFLAAKFLEVDMMRVLAKAGADTRLGIADGTTPLLAIAGIGWGNGIDRRGRDTSGSDKVPSDADQASEAAKAAIESGADVNATNEAGDTALHGAAARGYDAMIQELAGKGAGLDVRNKRGLPPLAEAKKSSADLLRKLGAKDLPAGMKATGSRKR